MFERLESDTRRAMLVAAKAEAQRRGDRRVGTDHLLLGLLHESRSAAVRALGVDLATAREAADDLDRAALAAIGVDPGEERLPPVTTKIRSVPLTSGSVGVLKLSIEEARRGKARRVQVRHVLLALLSLGRPDPAAQLLEALGVDRAQVRARLASPAAG